MTKLRTPLTFDAALVRVAGQMAGGYRDLAERCGRTARTVSSWGEPDTAASIPIDVALDFDLAFAEAGGEGSPFLEAFAHQREQMELAQHASRIALAHRAAEVIRECGEAGSALVTAALPGASPRDRARAHAELAEAFEVIKRTLPLLSDTSAEADRPGASATHQPRERGPP